MWSALQPFPPSLTACVRYHFLSFLPFFLFFLSFVPSKRNGVDLEKTRRYLCFVCLESRSLTNGAAQHHRWHQTKQLKECHYKCDDSDEMEAILEPCFHLLVAALLREHGNLLWNLSPAALVVLEFRNTAWMWDKVLAGPGADVVPILIRWNPAAIELIMDSLPCKSQPFVLPGNIVVVPDAW